MTKKSDLIKNPTRQLNKILHKREPYIPEHVRLGMEPLNPAPISPNDFNYAFAKRRSFVTSSGGKKEEPVLPRSEPRVTVVAKSADPKKIVPKQVMVSSGFQHEHTWHPTAKHYEEETIPEDQVEASELPWEDDKTYEELVDEEKQFSSGQINFDEIEFESMKRNLKEKNRVDQRYHQLDNIGPEQYCVTVNGNIVHIADSLEDVEEMVEYILFDQNCPLGDTSVEEVAVFKRLSIKAGVVVKE